MSAAHRILAGQPDRDLREADEAAKVAASQARLATYIEAYRKRTGSNPTADQVRLAVVGPSTAERRRKALEALEGFGVKGPNLGRVLDAVAPDWIVEAVAKCRKARVGPAYLVKWAFGEAEPPKPRSTRQHRGRTGSVQSHRTSASPKVDADGYDIPEDDREDVRRRADERDAVA